MQSLFLRDSGRARVSRPTRLQIGVGRIAASLTLGLVCLSPPAGRADPPVPVTADLVRELSEVMRERHPDLRALDHTAKAEQLNAEGVRRWANPEAMVGGGWYRFADMARENGDVWYGVQQGLPLFGKERAARKQAEAMAGAASVRVEARFAELRRDLAVSLFEAAATRMTADLIADDQKWLDAQVRLMRVRVASGADAAASVLRLENEADRRRLDWTNAIALAGDALVRVERMLGVTNGAVIPPSGYGLPAVADAVPFGPVLVRFAERAEPEVLRRERDIVVADATVETTRKSARPDVALGAQAYHESSTGAPAQGMFTLSVSLPWFNRANYRRDLERDKSRLAAAESAAEDARQAVRREVHALVTEIEASRREALLLGEKVVPRTRQLQATLEAQWPSGRAELRDLLDVRRQLIEAEAASIRATASYWRAISELLLCCGLEDLETLREVTASGGGAVDSMPPTQRQPSGRRPASRTP